MGPGGGAAGRLRADRRQGTRKLPDPRRSADRVRRLRNRPEAGSARSRRRGAADRIADRELLRELRTLSIIMDTLHDLLHTICGRLLPAWRMLDTAAPRVGPPRSTAGRSSKATFSSPCAARTTTGPASSRKRSAAARPGPSRAPTPTLRCPRAAGPCGSTTRKRRWSLGRLETPPVHRHADRRDRQRRQDDHPADDPHGVAQPAARLRQPANYNNHVGVPLSMLRIDRTTTTPCWSWAPAVRARSPRWRSLPAEGRRDHAARRRPPGRIRQPPGVAQAKGELLAELPESGQAVIVDDPLLRRGRAVQGERDLGRHRSRLRPPCGRRAEPRRQPELPRGGRRGDDAGR